MGEIKNRPARNVAVFCGAAAGVRPEYVAAASELGRALAARGIGLIYGGAKIGLMGACADATLAAGGHVEGVIPHVLVDLEVAHNGVTELHVVDTMHTRKALMGTLANAFVVLPGGAGTLEEFFEVVAWQSLKLHTKPIVLLNTAGYYDTMLRFMDEAEREGFGRGARARVLVAGTVNEALEMCGF